MKRIALFVTVVAGLLFTSMAMAQDAGKPDGQKILERVDQVTNQYKDQIMQVTYTITDVDGSKKSYDLTTYQLGDEQRLIRFHSGEIKGMSMLIENRNNMYVYLPGYKKVRRIAAHNMNQSFAGSDMSNDDMSNVSWSKAWNAVYEKEDENYYYIKLTQKPGENKAYAWVRMKAGKKDGFQWGAEYYNAAGEMVKKAEMQNLKTYPGGGLLHEAITYTDPRTGHSTLIFVHDLKVNQGLKQSMFTTRELEWGR